MGRSDIFLMVSGAFFVVTCIVCLTYGINYSQQPAPQSQPQVVIVRYECATSAAIATTKPGA